MDSVENSPDATIANEANGYQCQNKMILFICLHQTHAAGDWINNLKNKDKTVPFAYQNIMSYKMQTIEIITKGKAEAKLND